MKICVESMKNPATVFTEAATVFAEAATVFAEAATVIAGECGTGKYCHGFVIHCY